jgi:hypothetical protein
MGGNRSRNRVWPHPAGSPSPAHGDHDPDSTGGTDCPTTSGAGYQQRFGGTAGVSAGTAAVNLDPNTSYCRFNLGPWHIIGRNSGACQNNPALRAAGTPQEDSYKTIWRMTLPPARWPSCRHRASLRVEPMAAALTCGRSGKTGTTPAWAS